MEFKTYDISPWGEVAADTGSITRLRLAGQPYDQRPALYYMRARYYDPALGRFLSEDPIGISGGLNLYAYAGNDPVNAADPSGMSATTHIIVWGWGTDWCSTQWGCAPSGTTCAASTADGTGARWCYEDDQGPPGLPLPGMPGGGSTVPGTSGASKSGGSGGFGGSSSNATRGANRKCIADLAKLAVHVAIDATALNTLRTGIDLIHDAGVMRNVAGILDSRVAASAANRMMGAGVASVAGTFGILELVNGAARDLDVDYLIDRAAGVASGAPSLGRTLWGFLPGASSVLALGDVVKECL